MRRKLSEEEQALWHKVTEKTERLQTTQTFDPLSLAPDPKPLEVTPRPSMGSLPPKPVSKKGKSHDLALSLPERLQRAPVQMDPKAFKRMKRGKLSPEGRIDLHGMTLDRAHPALTRFIMSSASSGKRLVLVITGKGKDRDEGGPIPVRYGILRHQVPQWLAQAPLRSVVLQVTPAHISHGGTGAYYVYLRRQR